MSSANDLINRMPDVFLSELATGLEMTVQFMIEAPMYAVIANGECHVHDGHADTPDLTVTTSDADLVKLMYGDLNGVVAYMSGRLRVRGDLINARKLPSVFDFKRLR